MTQKVFNNMQEVYEHCKKDIFERVKIRFRSQEIAEDISSDIFAEIAAHCDWFIKQDGNRQSEYLFHIYMKVIEKYEEKEFNEKLVAYKEATYDELLANEDRCKKQVKTYIFRQLISSTFRQSKTSTFITAYISRGLLPGFCITIFS